MWPTERLFEKASTTKLHKMKKSKFSINLWSILISLIIWFECCDSNGVGVIPSVSSSLCRQVQIKSLFILNAFKKHILTLRVKMCTSVNDEDFYTVHHEMGHIEYFMAYANQPSIFK